MDENYYLDIFQKAGERIDKKLLDKKQLRIATGVYFDSVFLKLYKLSWANESANPLSAASRIFFSVWVNDQSIRERKIFYNIHALKLRQLHGYTITSREFAAGFRKKFKAFEKDWPNVSVNFGPLTLLHGWINLDAVSLQYDILQLAQQFLTIDYLVDDLLAEYKK